MKTFIEHIKDCANQSRFNFAESQGYKLSKVLWNEDRTEKQYPFTLPSGDWWLIHSVTYDYQELHFILYK